MPNPTLPVTEISALKAPEGLSYIELRSTLQFLDTDDKTAFLTHLGVATSAVIASTYAPLASPALTGTPTAPTAASGTNTTQLATTAFVTTAVADLIASAPGALNTLDELAAALGDDANFASTVTTTLALKAPLASPTFTGVPAAPTASAGTATTQLATTAFVQQGILKNTRYIFSNSLSSGSVEIDSYGAWAYDNIGSWNGYNPGVIFRDSAGTYVGSLRYVLANGSIGLSSSGSSLFLGGYGGEISTNDTFNFKGAAGFYFYPNSTFGVSPAVLSITSTGVALLGAPTAPTATAGTNTTQLATTAFVTAAVAAVGGSNYANVIHVAESGGDYTTLAAAKAAAVSGDLVIVHPGAYTATTSILKDGVNWHFEAGAIVSMDMTSNSTLVGILEDTTGITCQITGKGEFLADLTGRDGLPEITEITVSGTPGDGDYVTVHNFDDGTETSFYCKIDGVGTPSGSGNQVAVEVSGGFTTDDYAAALEAAMEANFFSATVSGSVVTATTDVKYSFTDASGTANFTISVLQQGVSLNAACIVKRVTGSVIDIEAHRIVLTSDDTNINFPYHITVWDEDGEGVTRASEIIATGQRTCATRWSNGPTHIYADKISGGYFGIWGDCNATPTGDYYITADLIEGTAGTGNAIWSNGTEAAAAMWIEAKIVKATGTNAVAIYTGSGKNYITAQKIFGKVAAGGQLFLRTDKLSPVANNTTLFSFTGICHIEVMTIDLNSFTGTILGSIIATAPSTVEIKNFVADSAGQELYLTGPVELLNSRLDFLACGNQKAVGIGDSNVKIRNSVLLGAGTGKDIDATGFTVTVCGGHGTGTSGHFRTSGTVNFLSPN